MNVSPEHDAIADIRRKFAYQVVEQLRKAGYEALWAGGCVRDLLLELAAMDYDVATSATPEQVRSLFGQRRTLSVGAAFGVIIVLGAHASAGQVEVATFRSDASYSDGRRPDSVVYSTAIEDAQRRDFTINGMFYDPLAEQIIDYVGGREDLQRGLIRAIGDADARIAEDKLRMLRAVRFAARFGFAIEAATQAALARHASELSIVSGERMASEMHKTLVAAGREAALRNWAETRLLNVLLPQLAQQWPEVGQRACALLRSVKTSRWTAPLAAILFPLLHCEHPTCNVHDLCDDLKHRLRLSNEDVSQLRFALGSQSLLDECTGRPWSAVQPTLVDARISVALDLFSARIDCGEADKHHLEWLQQRLAWPSELLDPSPFVNGKDLQRLGFSPGPQFKALLEQVRTAQLDHQLADRGEALEWLKSQLPSMR
jgi:poly(A) polymerase